MTFRTISLVAVLGLVLAACGSSGGGGVKGIALLGQEFVAMFNRAPNSEPLDAQAVDIAAIRFDQDPFNP